MDKAGKMEWRLPVISRTLLVGPSMSGKSHLIHKLLQDDTVWELPHK